MYCIQVNAKECLDTEFFLASLLRVTQRQTKAVKLKYFYSLKFPVITIHNKLSKIQYSQRTYLTILRLIF